jgi:hypothetical protein
MGLELRRNNMEELREYIEPKADVIAFEISDVITLSSPETDNNNDNVWEDIYG